MTACSKGAILRALPSRGRGRSDQGRLRAGPGYLGQGCSGEQRAVSAPVVLSVLIIVTGISFLLRSLADVSSR